MIGHTRLIVVDRGRVLDEDRFRHVLTNEFNLWLPLSESDHVFNIMTYSAATLPFATLPSASSTRTAANLNSGILP